MEYLALSLLVALSKLAVLNYLLGGVARMLWWRRVIEVSVLFILPALFFGTFQGMVVAIFSGLWITLFLALAGVFVQPRAPFWLVALYAKKSKAVVDTGADYRDTTGR
jgi:hypothetical protein